MSSLRELGILSDEDSPASLQARIFQGVALALGLTAFRLAVGLASGQPVALPPAPVAVLGAVVIGLAGAAGGAVYYATEGWRRRGGWRRTLANVCALLTYCLLLFGVLLLVLAQEG